MNPNTHSAPAGPADGLAELAAELDALAAQHPDRLPDSTRAQRVLALRRLLDRLEGHWLAELAAVDARGAAGADQGTPAPSTAGWLRNRLRMGAGAARGCVRTARALVRGPLAATGQALTGGQIGPAHAAVLAAGTHDLPTHTTVEAEPVLLEAAGRLDPPRLRRVLAHLRQVIDPEAADTLTDRQHARRGLWLAATGDGMIALDGLLDPEAGQTLLAALEPLARPANAADDRSGGQRRADALAELARRTLEGGRLPQTGGVRPQLSVVVDLDSLQGRPGAVGGEVGWAGPLAPEACRRLACDGAVTRVLVSRQPRHPAPADHHLDHRGGDQPSGQHPTHGGDLTSRLQAAMALLPPLLGGAPSQPVGPGPHHPGRHPDPTQRPGRARRRLGVPRLPTARWPGVSILWGGSQGRA